jgi:capsular polysaccharide export protein
MQFTSPHSPSALFCFGFGPWKRGFVRAFLRDFEIPVHFVRGPLEARVRGFRRGAALVVWGQRDLGGLAPLAERAGVPIWRMEDGFLRSVGLGSDFRVPSSLVLDTRGIYFDPRSPSDLEHILQHAEFSDTELIRAAALRSAIVARALSKYNFASVGPGLQVPSGSKRVVLVPGQVEDDASIACGAVDVRTNAQLLRAAREAAPDAYIIYKPHPDVVSGNRKLGSLTLEHARTVADAVVLDAPLPECLAVAHEVHTITSLVGFEALLRGKTVACYGRPFYSGWGLTQDRHGVDRRTRRLDLDMLVAGALIRYPRYLSQRDWKLTTPEEVVAELAAARAQGPTARVGHNRLLRRGRRLVAAVRGYVRHG